MRPGNLVKWNLNECPSLAHFGIVGIVMKVQKDSIFVRWLNGPYNGRVKSWPASALSLFRDPLL
jgi:hypothetical protein